ncbi:ThiF family adenylyltransferase [Flavobacterium sp. WLB]|uniref:HesA/MoeB/ThiF family protein n=1 Tax=unclassified Flavobacterium TaxID=196869 RepID=UPI0006ABDB06|nr:MULTISPECIES: ThiF family adenylyltransferase [unclassified Flavobacterium]KOP39317.1 thiamine biosynthesis protein ThiF [Flavobacterium sp. VMW]OWU91592.1 thiamine biosynthesis protein ThiF [Flavobacterium sp. NLM]PUU70744.1 ThiF family adenylyltransferase [Flavobacterium sp. WLB]
MDQRHIRNRLYITPEEQESIKNTPILLGGAGIGSVIAECLLRLGFETLTIIDGDIVELSNLNRQNYTEKNISEPKVKALKERLLSINSSAKITIHNCFLTPENVEEYITDYKIAINALDFTSDVPLMFDSICQKKKIPVIHPYNLGWGALVLVISDDEGLESLRKPNEKFTEINVVDYVLDYMRFWEKPQRWLEEILEQYKNEGKNLSPPQLSIASSLVAGICTNIAFDIVTNKPVKTFPEFYLTTIK